MRLREITLIFRRSDFEELYFKDDNDKIFFSPAIKKETYSATAILLACFASILYCILSNKSWQIIILILVFVVYKIWEFSAIINDKIKWKKSVVEYIDSVVKYNNYKIILSENAFNLISDENETIERWSEFIKAEITNEFITLRSKNENYIIPKKSVKPDEFEFLKKMVKDKINEISAISEDDEKLQSSSNIT